MKGKHVNFLHMPGRGLGVLLIRIFIKTEIRSFWVRTPNVGEAHADISSGAGEVYAAANANWYFQGFTSFLHR